MNLVLNMLPSYFFFSDYLIILFLWAEIYYYPEKFFGKNLSISHFLDKLFLLTILMYILGGILVTLNYLFENQMYSNVANDSTIFESLMR